MTELELPVEALLELRAADAPLRRLRERLLLSAKLLKQARADARPRVRASMGQTKLVRGLLSWRGRRRPAMEEQRTASSVGQPGERKLTIAKMINSDDVSME